MYNLKRFFYKFTRGFYHARKFLAVFGLVVCLIVFPVLLVSAETVTIEPGQTDYLLDPDGTYRYRCQVNGSFFYRNGPPDDFLDLYQVSYSYVGESASGLSRLVAGVTNIDQNVPLFVIPPRSYIDITAGFTRDMNQYGIPVRLTVRTHMQGEGYKDSPVYHGSTVTYTSSEQELSCHIVNLSEDKNMYVSYVYLESTLQGYTYTSSNYGFAIPMVHVPSDSALSAWREKLETDRIIENQNENTDKIINGYSPNPDNPEGSNSVGDYGQQEDELLQDQQQGLDDANNAFTSVIDNFLSYASAFFAVGGIINDLVSIPVFSFLLYASLALGIILLLFNLVGSVASSSRAKQDRDIRNEYYKSGKEYYDSGKNYYNSRSGK